LKRPGQRFLSSSRKPPPRKITFFYGFTALHGDEILYREAYGSAEGLLAHLENVAAPLSQMLKVADLIRVEVRGPADELEKLNAPMAHLNPAWFTLEASVERGESIRWAAAFLISAAEILDRELQNLLRSV
jgi:hypothetical protein